jgi:hypothetical protein
MTDEMGETPPIELPDALPERGVIVLQKLAWIVEPATAGAKFEENLKQVYGRRGILLVLVDYHDQPGKTLSQDKATVEKIVTSAQGHLVVVRFKTRVADYEIRPRHHQLEQDLVGLMTKRGIVVSLIGAADGTVMWASLYRPSLNGKPSMTHEKFDLTVCL